MSLFLSYHPVEALKLERLELASDGFWLFGALGCDDGHILQIVPHGDDLGVRALQVVAFALPRISEFWTTIGSDASAPTSSRLCR